MVIEPLDKKYWDIPIWCVCGPSSFPVLLCCKIRKDRTNPDIAVIWGYSIWGGIPGFRTLGQHLRDWISNEENRSRTDPIFFNDHDDALKYLKTITTPVESII
jgi:hypothetical protein